MRIVHSFGGRDTPFETDRARVVIGRAKPGVAIDLDLSPDLTVSRPHAVLTLEGSLHWIEDLGSAAGTQLNGEEIRGKGRRRVQPGDTIRIGVTTLRLQPAGMGTLQSPPIGTPQSHGTATPQSPVTWTPQSPPMGTPPRSRGTGTPQSPVTRTPPSPATMGGAITQTMDAATELFQLEKTPSREMSLRLALLYDLPIQLSGEGRLEVLLRTVVERTIAAIPGAAGGALLVQDATTGQLLLKAHAPAGSPAASLSLARQAMESRQGFIWRRGDDADVSMIFGAQTAESGVYVPILWKGEPLGVLCAVNYETRDAFGADDLRLVIAVGQYAAMAIVQRMMQEELRTSANLMTRLLTNFSPQVRERLLTSARTGRLRLGGQKSEVTVLVADIRHFTRLSAGMDAEDVVDMLNDYFSPLVDVVFRFDGTVDKFIGDAMLVVFGSPEADPAQHDKAVRAALAMQLAIQAVSRTRASRNQTTCEMGIGLHCGEVLHGFIGSNERMEFTVIGDTVNLATRYCAGAGPGEILISPQFHQWVWRSVLTASVTIGSKHEGDLPALRLKGLRS